MLAVFPFTIMFLITSIAMLRERTSGTLERLATTPARGIDLLFGYGIAFGLAAAVQAAWSPAARTGSSACTPRAVPGTSYWCRGADRAARRRAGTAVLRVRQDRIPGGAAASGGGHPPAAAVRSVRARGRRWPNWLEVISDALPLSYAVEAAGEVGRHARRPGCSGGTWPSWRAVSWSPCCSRRRPCAGGPSERRRRVDSDPGTAMTDSAPAARSGRRPGNPDTRQEILESARQVFAANGFAKRLHPADRRGRRGRPGPGAPLLRFQGRALPGHRGGARSIPAPWWSRSRPAASTASASG